MGYAYLHVAAIHSGMLAEGETGSIYVKCFVDGDISNNWPSTTSYDLTSQSSDNDSYGFKMYDVPSMITDIKKIEINGSDTINISNNVNSNTYNSTLLIFKFI